MQSFKYQSIQQEKTPQSFPKNSSPYSFSGYHSDFPSVCFRKNSGLMKTETITYVNKHIIYLMHTALMLWDMRGCFSF